MNKKPQIMFHKNTMLYIIRFDDLEYVVHKTWLTAAA